MERRFEPASATHSSGNATTVVCGRLPLHSLISTCPPPFSYGSFRVTTYPRSSATNAVTLWSPSASMAFMESLVHRHWFQRFATDQVRPMVKGQEKTSIVSNFENPNLKSLKIDLNKECLFAPLTMSSSTSMRSCSTVQWSMVQVFHFQCCSTRTIWYGTFCCCWLLYLVVRCQF